MARLRKRSVVTETTHVPDTVVEETTYVEEQPVVRRAPVVEEVEVVKERPKARKTIGEEIADLADGG